MARADGVTIHIVSRNKALAGHFEAMAASEKPRGMSCHVSRAEEVIGEPGESPHLMVIDLDSMTDEVLGQIPRFRQEGGRSWIAVTSKSSSPDRLLQAMRLGANDYLSVHIKHEEFQDLLDRALVSQGEAVASAPGQLVAVLSNKGGVGTTTVAINVAASLAAQGHAVAVVDLVLQHGDLSVFLDVPGRYTVVSLITELDRADASYLRSVLPRHDSGVYVLPSPSTPDEAEAIQPAEIGRLLQQLRQAFDVVVVDVGNDFHEPTLAALDLSDHLVLVTLPDLPSVRNTRRTLELFKRLQYDLSKVLVTVNRHNAKEPLSRSAMEEALGRPVHWTLPNEYLTTLHAINQGTVVRRVHPKGPLSTQFHTLVTTHLLERSRPSATAKRKKAAGKRPGDRARSQKVSHGTP